MNDLDSETTKDRFIQMYAFPDKIRSQELFSSTVLELVRLIQAALSIFNMFEITPDERDGLLCDVTVDGIQMWIAAIGEPVLNVEVVTLYSSAVPLLLANDLYSLWKGSPILLWSRDS